MDAFLEQARRRGAIDSSGGFSVNPFKALEKMAAFQSGDPGFYLLRFVQAAVLAKAEHVKVKLNRNEVQVLMEGENFAPPEPEEVERNFGKALADSGLNSLDMLMNGLNQLVAQAPDLVEMRWVFADGKGAELEISEARMRLTFSQCSESAEKPSLRIHIQRSFDPNKLAAETQSLHSRCACSTVPVYLDGHPVVSTSNPHSCLYRGEYPKGELSGFLPADFVLGERYCSWRGLRGLALPPLSEVKAQKLQHGTVLQSASSRHNLLLLQTEGENPDCFIRFLLNDDQQSRVYYIQSGVLISTEDLASRGLQVYICVDGMETDLTGTQLRKSAEYREMRAFIETEVETAKEAILSQVESLKSRFDWTPQRKQGAVTASVFGSIYLGSALVLLPVPVFGKIWAGGMLASTGLGASLGWRSKAKLDVELREKIYEQFGTTRAGPLWT